MSVRLVRLFFWFSLISLGAVTMPRPAPASSDFLVWKPYLQQVTETGVIISWATQSEEQPVVRYGPDQSYSLQAEGNSRDIPLQLRLHRVELTGLQPQTRYYYKIYVDDQTLLSSETLSFQTAPPPGSETPVTFIAFGDYGFNSNSQKRLLVQMLRDSFDFILTTGDNAYPQGSYGQFRTNVFQIYGDLFSRVPLFPTLGNHDAGTAGGAPYLDLFDLPQQAWRAEDQERYYSFDYGQVHVAALDFHFVLYTRDNAAADDMLDWLRHDLGQSQRRWKIVVLHVPPYSTGHHGSDSRVQTRLVPVLEDYGVDLVLTGHDHIYQRTHPLRGGQITPTAQGGIVYVVSGAGAAASYPCGKAAWVAISYCGRDYGLYSRIRAEGGQLTLEAVDEQGELKDSYILTRTIEVPVESLEINGPTTGAPQLAYPFTATASPLTSTLPITYTWEASEQPPVTNISGIANTVTFTWAITGPQLITVTAANSQAATMVTRTVILSEGF